MYCIKCGKDIQGKGYLCDECRVGSGFEQVSAEHVSKTRRYGMYLAVAGNLLMLLGLLCSFILIKPDAPTDYVSEIFKEETVGPVESEEATEENSDTQEEQEVQMETKGYTFSVVEYLSKRTPSEEDTEDIEVLNQVMSRMDSYDITALDLNDEEQVNQVFGNYDETTKTEALEILKYYSKSNLSGVIMIFISVAAFMASCWLAVKNDFRWSFVFSLIATIPVWSLIVRLNGITAWEFCYGMYLFVGGMFAVLLGVLFGGNVERCTECKGIYPGGAVFCADCGNPLGKKKERKPVVRGFLRKNSVIVSIAGNLVVFLPVVLPAFSMKADGGVVRTSIMGLRGLSEVKEKGSQGLLLFVLAVSLLFLVAAVVAAVFEKYVVSAGASLVSCAFIVLAVFFVQQTVDLDALLTIALLPIGLAIALFADLNAPLQWKEWMRKDKKQKEINIEEV